MTTGTVISDLLQSKTDTIATKKNKPTTYLVISTTMYDNSVKFSATTQVDEQP